MSHSEFLTFLNTLHGHSLIQLHKIRWDWRRSFVDVEKSVSLELQRILSSSERKATIITHSTGSIVTWPTINNHPEWFQSWINVAGAASGSNVHLHEFEHDWRYSDVKFLKILSKEVMFTCPSQYGFFRVTPYETFRNDNDRTTEFFKANSGGKNPIFVSNEDIDLYNVDTWERFKLGIYSWKNHIVTDQEREHLKNCLTTSKMFRLKHFVRDGKSDDDESFLSNQKESYDHLQIVCYGLDKNDTHSSYEVDLDKNFVETTKTKLYTTGDGTVPSFGWKRIFGGLKREIVFGEPDSTHVSLLNDLKLRNILMEKFFQDEEHRKEVQNILILDEGVNGKDTGLKKKHPTSTVTAGIVSSLVVALAIFLKFTK